MIHSVRALAPTEIYFVLPARLTSGAGLRVVIQVSRGAAGNGPSSALLTSPLTSCYAACFSDRRPWLGVGDLCLIGQTGAIYCGPQGSCSGPTANESLTSTALQPVFFDSGMRKHFDLPLCC